MTNFDLKDLNLAQLEKYIVGTLNLPAFRAKQIFSWIYKPGIRHFYQMTDIKLDLREALTKQTTFSNFDQSTIQESADGTVKYAFVLEDDSVIETVFIPEEEHNTLCISSQVGCAMDCKFCLTGTMGFKRNLRPSEIVNQVCAVLEHQGAGQKNITKQQQLISNLVFMGMGEPLANFDNLLTALAILTEQRGLDFSERKITVSTCGLVPKIVELGQKTKVNLAVSLHSVDDSLRSQLMPINKKYSLDQLLQACRDFPMPKRKRIMFEYILVKDVNDSAEDAKQLSLKLRDIRCKINLLPYNVNADLPYQRPSKERIVTFQKVLWDAGYTVLLRSSRGADISAACGQLAGKKNHINAE